MLLRSLADTYNALAFYGGLAPKDAIRQGKEAAKKALELDDSLAEAHTALASFAFDFDWDWATAEKEYQSAIQSNPGYATAHQGYATYLTLLGRLDEGLKEYERAQDLDPLSLVITADITSYYYYSRQYDKAIDQCKQALELDPDFALAHLWCGRAYLQKRMYPEAMVSFQRAAELQPESPLMKGLLGHAYAVTGERAKAEQVLNELKQRYQQGYASPALISLIYWALGDRIQSRAWGDRAYNDRDVLLTRLKMDPGLDGLRADPLFFDLLERLGFRTSTALESAKKKGRPTPK